MSLNCGIVGLPNVGKSTIFSALTSVQAQAENYPFCTIEPNVGLVEVPDERLTRISKIYNPKKTIPAVVEFVDIAGLVAGASKGEGLGNTFLSHIRETGIIAHVVRCFDDDNIVHVSGRVNPESDIGIISTELALADLASVERRMQKLEQEKKSQRGTTDRTLPILEKLLPKLHSELNNGVALRTLEFSEEEEKILRPLNLITKKPMLYICNIKEGESDNEYVSAVKEYALKENSEAIVLCGALETELAQLDKEERILYLQESGFTYSGLDMLIRTAYSVLGLRTYFTAGEKEVRAWTFAKGIKAPQAAGIIHSDFERGFIRAETFHCTDLFELGNEQAIRSSGKIRTEGKEYVVQDGDVMHFKFNV